MRLGQRLARPAMLSFLAVAMLAVAPAAARATTTNFDPSAGSYTIDTTTLKLTGPGTDITGTAVDGIAVFSFDDVSIPAGATITASGSRPLEIVASGSFALAGTIDASGTSATTGDAGPYPAGPGGGQGGDDYTSGGSGSGGGAIGTTYSDGGGGGGFGGGGASGGTDGGSGGAGGAAYGDLNTALQGGSGGAGASSVGGGGGGGGVELSANALTIATTGSVLANGGNGNGGPEGASGGGSGGGILLHADTIDVTGTVSADGGQGGTGGCCGDGGGGGGGRVAYQYVTLTAAGSPTVAGGTSGTSGPYGHGEESPEATGATGVITEAQPGSATTGSTSSVKRTSATVHGTVKPNGYSATYQFQYGTSTAYGKTAPATPASAGSGSGAVTVSAALTGLASGKTYYYRLVAYSLGFTVTGADRTFKTAKKSKPHVTTGGAASVKARSAEIKGSVNPEGSRTKYYFQYYASGHAIKTTPTRSAGSRSKSESVSAIVSSLSPSTTYHYRIVAKDPSGTARGRWRTFATRAAAPVFTG